MLKITISGPHKSGKTTVALLVEMALKSVGFEVENNDEDVMRLGLVEKAAESLEGTKVELFTQQLGRRARSRLPTSKHPTIVVEKARERAEQGWHMASRGQVMQDAVDAIAAYDEAAELAVQYQDRAIDAEKALKISEDQADTYAEQIHEMTSISEADAFAEAAERLTAGIDQVVTGQISEYKTRFPLADAADYILMKMGAQSGPVDSNGWQMDFWKVYAYEGEKYVLSGGGWYGGISFAKDPE